MSAFDELKTQFVIVEREQLARLQAVAKRLYTEDRMNGDQMRDAAHTITSVLDQAIEYVEDKPEAQPAQLMTFKEACDLVRSKGCTNLWTLTLFEPAQVRPMTDEWVAAQDRMQQRTRKGKWAVRNERYLYFTPDDSPTTAVRVYYAA